MSFLKITDIVHQILEENIHYGDKVLDATAGRGKDTAWMASLVGEDGLVYAFDIQEEACQITKELLLKENLLSRVRLFCDNHQHLQEYITEPLKAAVFNLGYLPGSDEKIITKSDSTYQAVLSSLELLAAGGIVLIAAYPGHAGGEDEYLRLCQLLASIDGKVYQTASLKILNRKNAPVLLMINKL